MCLCLCRVSAPTKRLTFLYTNTERKRFIQFTFYNLGVAKHYHYRNTEVVINEGRIVVNCFPIVAKQICLKQQVVINTGLASMKDAHAKDAAKNGTSNTLN